MSNRHFLILFLLLGIAAPALAQRTDSTGDYQPAPQLFRLNPEQYNHHFSFALPNGGMLYVDFLRLSDWGGRNQFTRITAAAAQQVRMLRDSFSSNFSNKLLAINIPIDERVILLDYKEDLSNKNQMAMKEGQYFRLKSGSDTIRIVRNTGVRTKPAADSGLIQLQYTFVLNNLDDILELDGRPEVMDRIGAEADAAIDKQKQKWSRPDARHHTLVLQYDPSREKPMRTDVMQDRLWPWAEKNLAIYCGYGAIVYNNSISVHLEPVIAYRLASRGKSQGYIGFSSSIFGLLSPSKEERGQFYTTYNLELGTYKKAPGFMQQRTSIALGIMNRYDVNGNNPRTNSMTLFHMGINLGVNSFLSFGLLMATNFDLRPADKGGDPQGFLGLRFSFNL